MKLSVVVPARNERGGIGLCLDRLVQTLGEAPSLSYEILVVDDNSCDDTAAIVLDRASRHPEIRLLRRDPPPGFGRAIQCGLDAAIGDVVVIFMADLSDDPEDILTYYRKIEEGYDCAFGSRFIEGSALLEYPLGKRVVNRIANRVLGFMFWTDLNDLTNAFKAYRASVIENCRPLRARDFDISIELSLGALSQGCAVAQIPIGWRGRREGRSKLSLLATGGPFLRTLLMWLRQLGGAGPDAPGDTGSGRLCHGRAPSKARPLIPGRYARRVRCASTSSTRIPSRSYRIRHAGW
jgi:dolichol-phosphate mannosyltransferase